MATSGARRGRLLAIAAIAAVLLLARLASRDGPVPAPAGVDDRADDAHSGRVEAVAVPAGAAVYGATAGIADWQILLLPDAGIAADAASVRIGLAQVSGEDMATHLVGNDAEGAGPAQGAEFAQVRRWLPLPATVQPDQSVRVGPLALQPADRYVLQAAGADRLRQYHADFSADTAPATLRPVLGAGLRVRRDAALAGDISILLRRAGTPPDAARWQSLLQRHPGLLDAFDERPWPLPPGVNELAPLPPQPVEALLLVDGIEAQRQALSLVAGGWSELTIDPTAHAVARQLAVELTLRFVVRGSDAPVEGLQVAWQHERGERGASSDASGRVRFAGVDRQREQVFVLRFPVGDAELPTWPQEQLLALVVDEAHADRRRERRVEHRVELDPLDWLIVASNGLPLDVERSAGIPYPVFVLQQRREGAWVDTAADHFRKVDSGLAVSLSAPGEYRVAAVMTPWTVLYSSAADARRPAPDGPHQVRLEAQSGRSVELLIRAAGQPLPRAQVMAIGPLRGMPPFELTADMQGRVRLHGVTVDRLRIEVPGYAQSEVALQAPTVEVQLQRDAPADAPQE